MVNATVRRQPGVAEPDAPDSRPPVTRIRGHKLHRDRPVAEQVASPVSAGIFREACARESHPQWQATALSSKEHEICPCAARLLLHCDRTHQESTGYRKLHASGQWESRGHEPWFAIPHDTARTGDHGTMHSLEPGGRSNPG